VRAGARGAVAVILVTAGVVAPASLSVADPFAELDLIRPSRPTAAPEFTVPGLTAGQIALRDLRGQVVFLNFWATWCPPCKQEMPSMERLYRRYKDRGFTVLAVSIDTAAAATVALFVKSLSLTFPIGLDPKMDVANRYTVRALPSSFLLDPNGYTVAVAMGPREWDGAAARAVIEGLLK
jgi:peroxiredoxin